MQELGGQELSLPGVQQLVRKPGVSGANHSGGQEFLRPAVQGSARRPGDGSELARGARSSNLSLRFPKVEIKLDASSARMVVGCKSSQ